MKEVGLKIIYYDTLFYSKLKNVLTEREDIEEQVVKQDDMIKICAYYQKGVDLTAVDFAVFPIHQSGHWTVIVLDSRRKSVIHYDPACASADNAPTKELKRVNAYLKFLSLMRSYGDYFDKFKYLNSMNRPTQSDNRSCGIFCLLYVRCVIHLLSVRFSQGIIATARKRIAVDIINDKTRCISI